MAEAQEKAVRCSEIVWLRRLVAEKDETVVRMLGNRYATEAALLQLRIAGEKLRCVGSGLSPNGLPFAAKMAW